MSKYNLVDLYEGMSEKEYDAAKEAERLEAHPERDKIKAIQALIAKEKAIKAGEKMGFDMRGIKEGGSLYYSGLDQDMADRIEGFLNIPMKKKFLDIGMDLIQDLIEDEPFEIDDIVSHLANELNRHFDGFQSAGDKLAGVDEGTCGYDRDAKTGKKLKGPGGLGKVNETLDKEAWGKLERLQHAIDDPDYIINSMMRAMSTDDANLYLDAMIRDHIDIIDDEEDLFGVEESTGPSDKAETEDDVVNVDKVASPSAKGVGYGAETSANTAEDDQEDKEIQNPPPMYEDQVPSLEELMSKIKEWDIYNKMDWSDDEGEKEARLKSDDRKKIYKDNLDEAKDWIQKAIKRPGALHRALDIPQDEDIPHSLINKDIKKMDDEEHEEGHLDKRDLRFLRQLDLAKTLEKFNEGEEPGKLDAVEDVINTLGDDDIEKIVAYMKERGRIKEYHETESYADYMSWVVEDIAQAYMEAHQYRRRMLRMSNKQLATLGKKIVDQKYGGDVGKAYDEIVRGDYKPVKKKKTMYSDKLDENGDAEDFADELKEDKDEYQLRKQVVNLVMKEKSVPISIAQEFFETHYDDIIDMNSDEILDEFDEFASVNYDSIDEDEKLREHFKRFM